MIRSSTCWPCSDATTGSPKSFPIELYLNGVKRESGSDSPALLKTWLREWPAFSRAGFVPSTSVRSRRQDTNGIAASNGVTVEGPRRCGERSDCASRVCSLRKGELRAAGEGDGASPPRQEYEKPGNPSKDEHNDAKQAENSPIHTSGHSRIRLAVAGGASENSRHR